jgi:hypothetical protein
MTYQGCFSRVVQMVKIMLVRGIGIRACFASIGRKKSNKKAGKREKKKE